jgi:flagellar basal body-associated protein FliL
MQKQKGFIQIILLAVIVLMVVGVGIYYYFTVNKYNGSALPVNTSVSQENQADYQAAAQNVPAVVNGADLDKVTSILPK